MRIVKGKVHWEGTGSGDSGKQATDLPRVTLPSVLAAEAPTPTARHTPVVGLSLGVPSAQTLPLGFSRQTFVSVTSAPPALQSA